MFCSKCGSNIPDNAAFCPTCGAPVNRYSSQQGGPDSSQMHGGSDPQGYYPNYDSAYSVPTPAPVPDAPSFGFAVLGFFLPLVGLILYLVWKDDTPLKAKSVGKGALIGFIVSVVLGLIVGIVVPLVVFGSFYEYF